MRKFIHLMLGLFISALGYGQCMNVKIGVIIDEFVDPCKGPITLDAEIPGMNYLWSTGATTQKIIVRKTGIYTVAVDDGKGCIGADTIHVTFLDNPSVDLGPDPVPQCGGCVPLQVTKPKGGSVLWSTGETNASISYCTPGANKVWAQVTNNLGCSASDTIKLTIMPGYDPSLGPDIVQCGDSAVLTSANLGGSYSWNTGETTRSITVHSSGTYYVNVSSMSGCNPSQSVSDTILVTLHPNPAVDLGPDPAPKCGGCIQLNAGNHPQSSVVWSTGDTSAIINYCVQGIQKIWTKVTDSNNCTASDTINVTIKTPSDPALGNDLTLCGNEATLSSANLGGSYLWNTGETSSKITVQTSGKYYVTVSGIPGCRASDVASDTIEVTFLPALPAPAAISDLSTQCGDKKYSVAQVAGATDYQWKVPQGWIIKDGQGTSTIVVKADELSQGAITVTAGNGMNNCTSTEATLQTRETNFTLHVPNTFSPNSDGINDVWVIRNIEHFPDNELIIMNRWGNEIFRKKSYSNDWDGSELNEGTYFFKLKIRLCDEEKTITDYLTIVR